MSDAIEIIPTVVPKDAGEFADAVAVVKKFSSRIHLDIDDGVFAPNPTWPYLPSGDFMPFTLSSIGIEVEAHLMVKDPRAAGEVLAGAGASRIVGHIEAFADVQEAQTALAAWRAFGAQAGIALLMNTSLDSVAPLIDQCDVVQLMSIDVIGAQGARFDPRAVARVAQVRAMYPHVQIAVDGGVNHANIADLVRVGARQLLIGSAIMRQADPAYAYNTLLTAAKTALI